MVAVRGEAVDPNREKLKDVNLLDEKGKSRVQINWSSVCVARLGFKDRPKSRAKWVSMELADLDRLKKFVDPEPKFSHMLCGIGLSGARPMVSANCAYNQAKALLGRVFRQPEVREWGRGPKPGVWEWAWQFVDELLPEFRSVKMEVPDWLKTMPARRRVVLEKAAKRYQRLGWSDSYAKFSAFVKSELLPDFAKSGGDLVRLEEMLDRLIQGPSDETHVITGPWLKPLVKQLKSLWGPTSTIHYGSCGPESLHQFLREKIVDAAHSFFWCDFSMYDNTHSDDSWDFMAKLYKRAGIEDVDFWSALAAWRQPSGQIGPMRYQARVMNASGRDDTALANGILNGFATFLSVTAAFLGKPLLAVTVEDVRRVRPLLSLSVCGDDSLGALPPMSREALTALNGAVKGNIAQFGFEAKLQSSTRIHDAVYLGMRPYPTEKGWFWGKTIGRATYKMGWMLLSGGVLGKDPMAHITGVADMHVLCSTQVPVLSDMASKIVELRQNAKRTPVALDPNRPWEWTYKAGVPYDEVTLKHVAEVYSTHTLVTAEDVKDLIRVISGVSRLPCVIDHWVWRRMVEADDL